MNAGYIGADWAIAHAALLWLAAAIALGVGELIVPGVFLIFLAAAAAITGATVFALGDVPPAAQLASFAAWSVAAVLVGRRWYRDFPVATADPQLNDRAARMIGQIATVAEPIAGGRGRVRVGDGEWPARGPDADVGARLRIVGVEDGVVLVAATDDAQAPVRVERNRDTPG